MNISGVPTLRGFIFQKKVFVYYILTELKQTNELQFEGLYDDIAAVTTKPSIFNISGIKDSFIQVKSGKITKNIVYDVFTNWMLSDFNDHVKYFLISEKALPTSFSNSDSTINNFYEKTQTFLVNNPKSNMGKLGFKYKDNFKKFKIDFLKFYNNFKSKVISMDEITTAIFDAFSNDNGDVQIQTLLETRLNVFLNNINQELEKNICSNQPFILTQKEYSRIRNTIAKQITEKRYELSVSELNIPPEEIKNHISQADEYLVGQLRNLYNNNSFIYENLLSKIEYSRFRSLYENCSAEITGNEIQAKLTYSRNKANPRIETDYDLYDAVLKETLNFKLLYENQFSRMGCYNYLASKEALQSPNKITWRKNDGN